MFESHFTKWEWIKISLIASFIIAKYKKQQKFKKLVISLYVLLILICIIGNISCPTDPFFLWCPAIPIVLTPFLSVYSQKRFYSKRFIFFYNTPSIKKQEKYKREYSLETNKQNVSNYDFEQHTILNKKRNYYVLVETQNLLLLFYKSQILLNGKHTQKLIHQYIVIKKSENKEILNQNSKDFRVLLKPYYKNHKK